VLYPEVKSKVCITCVVMLLQWLTLCFHCPQLWLSNSTEVYLRAYETSMPTVKLGPVVIFLMAMSTALAAAFLANTPRVFFR